MTHCVPSDWAAQIRAGSRRTLARAITLIESTRATHRDQANQLLLEIMPETGRSIRLGISGVPGAGKSTFIESFGQHLVREGKRLAVLAVDPSSALSGGSILGDKTRMENLSRLEEVFIRPSPSGTTHGGVTRHTRETILLCEAAGYDVILVETVGVGQSETAVADMTDLFLLLLMPGAGDELQGMKRGIVELADLIVVNKADGELKPAAQRAAADYRHALDLLHPRTANWRVPVLQCSALEQEGLNEVWQAIQDFQGLTLAGGDFERRRQSQATSWLWDEAVANLLQALRQHPRVRAKIQELERAVAAEHMPASVAAQDLVRIFRQDAGT